MNIPGFPENKPIDVEKNLSDLEAKTSSNQSKVGGWFSRIIKYFPKEDEKELNKIAIQKSNIPNIKEEVNFINKPNPSSDMTKINVPYDEEVKKGHEIGVSLLKQADGGEIEEEDDFVVVDNPESSAAGIEEEDDFVIVDQPSAEIEGVAEVKGQELPAAPSTIVRPKEVDRIIDNFSKSALPNEAITLYDSTEFMKYLLRKEILEGGGDDIETLNTIYQNLSQYYDSTHLTDEFEDLRMTVLRGIINEMEKEGVQNPWLSELKNMVMMDIRHKLDALPSIAGTPTQVINMDDVKFIQANGTPEDKQKLENLFLQLGAFATLPKYSDLLEKLKKLDLESSTASLSSQDLTLVVEAKKALLELELSDIGRKFNLQSLVKSGIPELDKLFECHAMRGDRIDRLMLVEILKEHNAAPIHPKVGIEGGGPSGLLLALTQFQAGADVSLFESRSAVYSRTQVVRLDPKWVSMLQFYLGEKFNQLFVDENHKGTFRPDGFVEIVTRDLEDVLNQRLSELRSLAEGDPNHPRLEMLAAHEVKTVHAPKDGNSSFTLEAVYDPVYAAKWEAEPKKQGLETREIDILICAGGKSSSTLQTYLPSSNPVNNPEYYGVCSWVTPNVMPFKGQKPDLTFFQDFRGMVEINKEHLDNFKKTAIEKMSETLSLMDPEMSSQAQDFEKEVEEIFGEIDLSKWTNRPFVQTRTFENRGLIYIGMELPSEFEEKLKEVALKVKGPKSLHDMIDKDIRAAWYIHIGEQIEKDIRSKLTEMGREGELGKEKLLGGQMNMDEKFLKTFPVEQNRLHKDALFADIEAKGHNLLITAAGDANASPHFMRYSGLTGARENAVHLQEYVKEYVRSPQNKTQLLETLGTKGERISEFVINRGRAFLQDKSEAQIDQERFDHALGALKEAVKEWKQPVMKQLNDENIFYITLSENPFLEYTISAQKNGTFLVNKITGPDDERTGVEKEFNVKSLEELKMRLEIPEAGQTAEYKEALNDLHKVVKIGKKWDLKIGPNPDQFFLEVSPTQIYEITPRNDGAFTILEITGQDEDSLGVTDTYSVKTFKELEDRIVNSGIAFLQDKSEGEVDKVRYNQALDSLKQAVKEWKNPALLEGIDHDQFILKVSPFKIYEITPQNDGSFKITVIDNLGGAPVPNSVNSLEELRNQLTKS